MQLRNVVLVLMTGACARGTVAADDVDAGARADARPADAAIADAPGSAPDAPPAAAQAQLLLSEVVLQPTAAEMIEIVNPSSQAVDLSRYYLADSGAYFRVPAGPPTIDASDFIVRFPTGASIPAGGVVTVALDTAGNFTTTYGVAPTYSIASATMVTVKANGVAGLTNAGEMVALFHWDGQGDLVRDVDLVIVGVPTTANGLVDKSGVMVDGPDLDSTTTAYKADARTLAAQASAPGSSLSTKRLAREAGHEVQGGAGNGLTGDDETTENTAMTWDAAFTAPTPGTVPAALQP